MTDPGPADDRPTEAVPVASATAAEAPADGAESAGSRRTRLILIASVTVIAAAGLLLAFFLGTRLMPSPSPLRSAVQTPSASITPTPAAPPSPTPTAAAEAPPIGPVAPGVYDWDRLGGGECLEPYTSPWERQFTVVDCAAPHTAQLVARGTFDGDAAAAYPGEQALTAQLNLRCTAPEVLDLGAAGAYADVQFQASYPAGEEQWRSGDRAYFCFVSRSSGQPLTGSIAAAG
ncbi:septum formation family protein [Naasia aerilata]|uniref:Septum formation-related domain-containing protein n=1 Tax=Naasia aerilata TaxID=1162966 RepID=A0ABN6XK34_9MICO|nr:septum formation family protein [Naasia aerilata]BDZ45289.1 hypothetical protein GCM10025866_11980 [Naasia aerilata]